MLGCLLALAIELTGVTGSDLRVRAFFDANNVKVGDPLVLTVDFVGEADFASLHPPALARHLDSRDWKLSDASAKTDTYRDARRLTYRVRPMRPGVLVFPALTFSYADGQGRLREVRSNEIPVHAKVGAQVVVAGLKDEGEAYPPPPAVILAPRGPEDEAMNEATFALGHRDWKRAEEIYSQLEWRIGQTPEIEQGLLAARALRFGDPSAELPVWRQVLRPLLRHAWPGRAGLVVGTLAGLILLFWLLGRGIRALACVAALLLALPPAARGDDPFAQFEQMHRQMQQMMNQSFGGGSVFSFGGETRKPPRVTAAFELSRPSPRVGEPFEFVISLEVPKTVSVGSVSIRPSATFGLSFTGRPENLTDAPSSDPSNVVKRISLPARYDVPYRGPLSFVVEGQVSGRESRGRGRFSFTFSNSFQARTPPREVSVRPLPGANQPADFAGIVSEGLELSEACDLRTVGTNDVVTITYVLRPKGFVPKDFLPAGAAFEWARQTDREERTTEIVYRRFFVADGAPRTPRLSVSYYDPRTQTYETALTGGTELKYEETH